MAPLLSSWKEALDTLPAQGGFVVSCKMVIVELVTVFGNQVEDPLISHSLSTKEGEREISPRPAPLLVTRRGVPGRGEAIIKSAVNQVGNGILFRPQFPLCPFNRGCLSFIESRLHVSIFN